MGVTAMIRKRATIALLLILPVAGVFGMRGGMTAPGSRVNIQFEHYGDAGLPEQDVFLEHEPMQPDADPDFLGAGRTHATNVFRVEADDARTPAVLDQRLFAARTIVPHDPFRQGSNPLGPYLEGERLGITLRRWLAARGSGTYTVSGADAKLELSFQELVPQGQYALWCSRVSLGTPYAEAEQACGATDGSQNGFKADAQGSGRLDVKLKKLPQSSATVTTMLALSYERNADAPEGERGGYGLNSHVQLWYAFPP